MPRTGVRDLQPGAVVSVDVRDANGRALLPAGAEITERHLRAFRMWGVTDVEVRGADSAAPAVSVAIPDAVLAAVRPVVDDLFRHADRNHPAVAVLAELAVTRRARQVVPQEPPPA